MDVELGYRRALPCSKQAAAHDDQFSDLAAIWRLDERHGDVGQRPQCR
jgi:hypothetical protein